MIGTKTSKVARAVRGASVLGCAAVLCAAVGFGLAGCSPAPSAGSSSAAASSSAGFSGSDVAPVEESSSASAVAAGQMSVKLELTDALDNEYAPDSPNQFAEETLTVVVPEGATALDVLEASGREFETAGAGDALEVQSIGGLARGDAGEGSHWELSVNGEPQRLSPSVVVVEPDDTVTYNFVGQEGAN